MGGLVARLAADMLQREEERERERERERDKEEQVVAPTGDEVKWHEGARGEQADEGCAVVNTILTLASPHL